MQSITIDVQSKHYKKVLTILEALQPELIDNIHSTATKSSAKPINSSLKSKNNPNRYLSKDAYKQKIQQKALPKKDEFLSASPSSSKYLSPDEYKKRLGN